MSLRVGFVALVLIGGVVGCSRPTAPVRPEVTPRIPVAALFQYSDWSGLETRRTPWLVVYSDRTIIIRRDDNLNRHSVWPAYWQTTLTEDEMDELVVRQTKVLRDPAFASYYELSDATDLNRTVFYFGGAHVGMAIEAYELSSEDRGPMAQAFGTEFLPLSMLQYYVFLTQLRRDSRKWTVWKPDSFVAWLRPEGGNGAASWPTAWPGWSHARIGPNGGAEIVVPVTSQNEFWSRISPGSYGMIAVGGRQWRLFSYPYFPGSEIWQRVIERDVSDELVELPPERPMIRFVMPRISLRFLTPPPSLPPMPSPPPFPLEPSAMPKKSF